MKPAAQSKVGNWVKLSSPFEGDGKPLARLGHITLGTADYCGETGSFSLNTRGALKDAVARYSGSGSERDASCRA
jgi:hypothetical protein